MHHYQLYVNGQFTDPVSNRWYLAVPPVAIIGAILAMYVLLGCVMDELSMLLLFFPAITLGLVQLLFRR